MTSRNGSHGYQTIARAELTVAILIEGVVIMVVLIRCARMCLVEENMELFTGMLFQEVHDHLRHAKPLVQLHSAEAIEGEGEGEEDAAHCEGQM